MIGIGVLASSSAAVNILNTGIPGTYGSIDMHYTGVVRMWDMPYSVYVELFQSTKGEMITALQQRIYGMLLGVGGFSQFGSPNQVKNNNNIFWRNVVVMW